MITFEDERFFDPDITCRLYSDGSSVTGPEQACYLRERSNWIYPYGVASFSCDKPVKEVYNVKNASGHKYVSVIDLDTFVALTYDTMALRTKLLERASALTEHWNSVHGSKDRCGKRQSVEEPLVVASHEFTPPMGKQKRVKSQILILFNNANFVAGNNETEDDVVCGPEDLEMQIKMRSTNSNGDLSEIDRAEGLFSGWGFKCRLFTFLDLLDSTKFQGLAEFAKVKVDELAKEKKAIPFYKKLYNLDGKKAKSGAGKENKDSNAKKVAFKRSKTYDTSDNDTDFYSDDEESGSKANGSKTPKRQLSTDGGFDLDDKEDNSPPSKVAKK